MTLNKYQKCAMRTASGMLGCGVKENLILKRDIRKDLIQKNLRIDQKMTFNVYGLSPSGKAHGFDPCMHRFEPG